MSLEKNENAKLHNKLESRKRVDADAENKNKSKAEVNAIRDDVADSIKQVTAITDKAEHVLNKEETKSFIYKIAETIDDSTAMAKLRDLWDGKGLSMENRDRLRKIKWLIINKPDFMMPDVIFTPLKYLYKCGFLSYHADPEMEEEYHRDQAEFEKKVLNMGIVVGSVFEPAMKVLIPLLKPINRALELKETTIKGIRTHLRKRREIALAVKNPTPGQDALAIDKPTAIVEPKSQNQEKPGKNTAVQQKSAESQPKTPPKKTGRIYMSMD